jgi:hypothetical protein
MSPALELVRGLRVLLFALFILAFGIPKFAFADAVSTGACQLLFAGHSAFKNLSETQIAALKEASSFYDFKTYSGLVNGIERTIVLGGEVHFALENDEGVGAQVLDRFPYRAGERMNPKSYWLGRFLRNGLEGFALIGRRKIMPGLLLRADYRDVAQRLARKVIDGSLTLEQLARAVASKKNAYLNRIGEVERYSRSMDWQLIFDQVSAQVLSETSDLFVNFPLEEGHQPTRDENIFVSALTLSGYLQYLFDRTFLSRHAGAILMLTSFVLPDQWLGPGEKNLIFNSAIALVTAKVLNWTSLYLLNAFGEDFIVEGRNQTMARNTLTLLQSDPKLKTLLVLVGGHHVDGMDDLFKEAGFQQQRLW